MEKAGEGLAWDGVWRNRVRVRLGLVDKEVGICGGGKWRIEIGIGIWPETRGGKEIQPTIPPATSSRSKTASSPSRSKTSTSSAHPASYAA